MGDKMSHQGGSQKPTIKFVQNSFIGLSGMVIMNSLIFPLQVVRTRLQTTTQLLRQGRLAKPYKGLTDCIEKIVNYQGYKGFWKGNFANILRFMTNDILNFTMKQSIQLSVKKHHLATDDSLLLNFYSASIGAIFTLGFIYPMQYVRTRLTNQITDKKSTFVILMETFKKQGITGIYRGSLNYFVSAIIFRTFYFGIFDSIKKKNPQNLINRICGSYLGAIIAIFSVYPFDTIRKRMIMTSGSNYKYQGFIDCARQILKKQGVKSYFKGWQLSLLQGLGVAGSLVFLDKVGTEVKEKGGIQ